MSEARPYSPSNSSEGEWFMGQWCAGCSRDSYPAWDDHDGDDRRCPILGNGLAGLDPVEWVQDAKGPRCTGFTEDPRTPVFDPNAVIAPLL